MHPPPTLHFSLPALFILLLTATPGKAAEAPTPFAVRETGQTLTLLREDRPILVYHKAEVPPPPGEDPAYTRSGFIHPLHTPAGRVVTGIHPPDHLHHLGLWHAWTKTRHQGRDIDFWNLREKSGTVRFAKTLDTGQDDRGAHFTVGQQHAALGPGGNATIILREELTVRASFQDNAHVVDYSFVQTNITDAPLELPAYRYGGGLACRTPHSWDQTNSDYLTSEGRTRPDSNATRARWCAMSGPVEGGTATLAVLGHPANHDAPQRLRTWDARQNNGRIFLNFCPVQETAWAIAPGESITLRYRIVALDGPPDPARLDALGKKWAVRP
jgi:hypothetical protein